jgi:hypothetical protein
LKSLVEVQLTGETADTETDSQMTETTGILTIEPAETRMTETTAVQTTETTGGVGETIATTIDKLSISTTFFILNNHLISKKNH